MEKEIAHLLEDDVTENAQLRGATLPLENRTSGSALDAVEKTLGVAAAAVRGQKPTPAAYCSIFEEATESAIALAFFIPALIGTGVCAWRNADPPRRWCARWRWGKVRLRDMGRVIRKRYRPRF